MSEWSHLPNAAHIDRVIESVVSHPEVWDAARGAAVDAALEAAWGVARIAARNVAWFAAEAALNAAWGVSRYAALDAILALIAYDDAVKYLNMPSDQLKMWAILSEEPAAVLLLPVVIAYEKISKLELA